MQKLYIYLANRNKNGIKVLSVFLNKNEYAPTKITETSRLGLQKDLQSNIEKATYENRMYWDLWIESAESYSKLKESLKKRGYYNIPLFSSPMFQIEHMVITNSEFNNFKKNSVSIKPVTKKVKTMVQKKKF